MGANSSIEWTDHTFNPWTGCLRVSPGCDNCYAAATAKRNAAVFGGWEPGDARKRTSAAYWRKPLAWNAEAKRGGRRARVFCASMADVFDNCADPAWRCDLWDLIAETPHLDWLLLTKRPQNIADMLPPGWRDGYSNAWLGTTVENQAEADRRIPHLLKTPAAKRFLSCEPLLGPVDLSGWMPGDNGCQGCDDGEGYGNRCSRDDIPREEQCPWNRAAQYTKDHGPYDAHGCPAAVTCHVVTIDWVISGGESGPGARPSHPDWHRSLRDQCAAAGVPFFFKQWGEWAPAGELGFHGHEHKPRQGMPPASMLRVGKKAAGALLDGREHREFPA